ncbi:hypothetical protein H310_04397 [Aphanomyces invadans]|uniref:START domain-containing protein n=1 Tax=Aphanomyces invadans TaxID=157072 RepID=A0A024UDP0_9STRA|nr:hypothetical protein H310_04397 [Aphanomyces invadans]ETW03992.1 hypothetical protein H310_04397 [Aphanomyces invadans]|eukprot:XP_008866948.1 hypothetical protein H310_04397 [Aphanomyces invadans]
MTAQRRLTGERGMPSIYSPHVLRWSTRTSRGFPQCDARASTIVTTPTEVVDQALVTSTRDSSTTSMPRESHNNDTLLALADAHCVVDLTGKWRRLKLSPPSQCRNLQLYRGASTQGRGRSGMVERSMYAKTSVVASLAAVTTLLRGANPQFNLAFHRDTVEHVTVASIHRSPAHTVSFLHDTLMHANAACDLFYLQCQETLELNDNRQGFVSAMHSACRPSCHGTRLVGLKPALPRASLRHSGIIAVESPLLPGVVDIVYVLHMAFDPPMAATSCDKIMLQRLLSLQCIAKFASPRGLRWLNKLLPA